MPKTRLLITGGTGFIGRNVAEYFAGRDDLLVTAVCHQRPMFECAGIAWLHADLTNAADVERCVADADVIIHAAAATSGSKDILSQPQIHITDNAVMNSLILRAAFEHKIQHLIFFSCMIMYPPKDWPLVEDDFTGNDIGDAYFGAAWTKIYFEKMCEFFARLGKTKFTVVRHSNIYGPHDKFDLERSHVFGATVTKVLRSTDGQVTVWGSGEEGRDLLYVDDLVGFVDAALERQIKTFGLYNVGSGKADRIRDLIEKIVAASGRDLEIVHDLSKPTIPTNVSLDCTLAMNDFGWTPNVSLDDGIARTIAWWRNNIRVD